MVRKFLALAAVVVAVAACDGSKKQLEQTLAQVQQISSEKDSLLKDVMATSQFIAEVNTELGKIRSRTAGRPVQGQPGEMESNLTPAQQREAIKVRVIELTSRLNESESRLTASRNRVRDLTASNTGLATQLAAYDSTIASFKVLIDGQRTEIASLTEQINALQAENVSLKQEKATLTTANTQLTEQKQELVTEQNLVYYVIGTEDELSKKGIIVKQGGLLGIGKTTVPAAALNAADFTAIDRTQLAELAFPKPDKAYKIVSRQDVNALATAPDKSNRIRGGLKITDAVKFWGASKYLIIIEQ